jgi:EAL domain-containing protein (putative c-di-GMP-specific phosphodiesterase class I)
LIPPSDFIPLAEESGLILPIGDWVLAEACGQIQKWCVEDISHVSLRVGVNLSARQFSRVGLADHVEALLVQTGISSRQLGLEMTESSLIPNMTHRPGSPRKPAQAGRLPADGRLWHRL